jgi:hypothetical protein
MKLITTLQLVTNLTSSLRLVGNLENLLSDKSDRALPIKSSDRPSLRHQTNDLGANQCYRIKAHLLRLTSITYKKLLWNVE